MAATAVTLVPGEPGRRRRAAGLQLTVTDVAPSTVAPSAPGTLTFTVRLTNPGDTPVGDVRCSSAAGRPSTTNAPSTPLSTGRGRATRR